MELNKIISENVKSIREQRKLTLDGAANITGVSRSMLAQIEKGEVNPTITVLWKIANGYKVSFSSLTAVKSENVTLNKFSESDMLSEDEGRYKIYSTFTFDEQKLFESYRVVMQKDAYLSAKPHMNGSEEYITVFEGSVEITVDTESFLLEEGDSLRFSSNVPHSYRNTSNGCSQMSMLIYYNK